MKRFLISLLFILFLATPVHAVVDTYWASAASGGATGSMDGIDGDILSDGDKCMVQTTSGVTFYTLDADSGVTESIPTVIAPDDNPGNKRWLLVKTVTGNEFYADPSVADQGIATTELNRSLYDIKTLIGTSEKATIKVSHYGQSNTTAYVLSTSLTLTSNFSLEIENGALITPDAGISLTVYSPEHIVAPPNQRTFDISAGGTIAFSSGGELYVDRFGNTGIPGGDDSVAINAAILASKIVGLNRSMPVMFGAKTYYISNPIVISNSAPVSPEDITVYLKGSGTGIAYGLVSGVTPASLFSNGTLIFLNAGSDCNMVDLYYINHFRIENIVFFGNGTNQTVQSHGIETHPRPADDFYAHDGEILQCAFIGMNGDGLNFTRVNDVSIEDTIITNCERYGLYIKLGEEPSIIDCDIEANQVLNIYLKDSSGVQIEAKTERNFAYPSVRFENTVYSMIKLKMFDTQRGLPYFDETSNYNEIQISGGRRGALSQLSNNAVSNFLPYIVNSYTMSWPLSITSDLGTDLAMTANSTAAWTTVAAAELTGCQSGNGGLLEFAQSMALTVFDDAADYAYQDIANATISAAEYLFVNYVSTPENSDDYLKIEIIEDPVGTPETLYSHTIHASTPNPTVGASRPFQQHNPIRDWGVIPFDGAKDARLKFSMTTNDTQAATVMSGATLKESLLSNGSFTDFTGGDPDDWTIIDGGISAVLSEETGDQYTGGSALKITSETDTIQMRATATMASGTWYLAGIRFKALTQAWIDSVYAEYLQFPGAQVFSVAIGDNTSYGFPTPVAFSARSGENNVRKAAAPPLSPGWIYVWVIAKATDETGDFFAFQIANTDGGEFLVDDAFVVEISDPS